MAGDGVGGSYGAGGSLLVRRLDDLIMHQMRFEKDTSKKFIGVLKMITAFSQAMWQR